MHPKSWTNFWRWIFICFSFSVLSVGPTQKDYTDLVLYG